MIHIKFNLKIGYFELNITRYVDVIILYEIYEIIKAA